MNKESEQLTINMSLVMAKDQPLRGNALFNVVTDLLGTESTIVNYYGQKVVKYHQLILLLKSVTYLGNPHAAFKKRIQLPDEYSDFCTKMQEEHPDVDVRFIGVYHYEDNIMFVDFIKDTYLQHGLHNSSAHVYTNDLYQGMQNGVFSKIDQRGNTLKVIRADKFADYLCGREHGMNAIFSLFERFNVCFPFGQQLHAMEKIKEMHEGGWSKWQLTEWAGMYLEYLFDKFTKENNLQYIARYISHKKKGELDFDILFEQEDFYGDLKASDITKLEAPGNKDQNVIDCIYSKHRLWYIIYEHCTVKDIDCGGVVCAARVKYIKEVTGKEKSETSYIGRMKNNVNFQKMTIIELNPINYNSALSTFAQGQQANGDSRKPKFKITKRILHNDNFVVFRYNHQQA